MLDFQYVIVPITVLVAPFLGIALGVATNVYEERVLAKESKKRDS